MTLVQSEQAETAQVAQRWPQVVVLGAGFGGLNTVQGLRNAPVVVTVVDRRNYHLFQPLLYQVATAGFVARADRHADPPHPGPPEECNGADGEGRGHRSAVARGRSPNSRRIRYDCLVVATGARHAYFGHDEWAETAPGLKTIGDATEIRARILTGLREGRSQRRPASAATQAAHLRHRRRRTDRRRARRRHRRAGAKGDRPRLPQYRFLDCQGGARRSRQNGFLRHFPKVCRQSAKSQLEKLGVEVRLGHAVTQCDDSGVALADGDAIGSACVLWAAGVMASRAAKWLGSRGRSRRPCDRQRRSQRPRPSGNPGHRRYRRWSRARTAGRCPASQPAAKQMGRYAARF